MYLSHNCLLATSSTFLFCWFLLAISRKIFSRLLPNLYNKLNPAQRLEWDSRVVSTLASLSASTLLVPSILKGACRVEPGVECAAANELGIGVVMGYLTYDFLLVAANYGTPLFAVSTVVHHILGLSTVLIPSLFNAGFSTLSLATLAELSTPFVNLRWHLDVAGKRGTPLYNANGLAIWGMFLGARLIAGVYNFYLLFTRYWTPLLQSSHMILAYSVLFQIAFFALNCYWFYFITIGILKGLGVIVAKKKEKIQVQKQE